MKNLENKNKILEKLEEVYARNGADGATMRSLAKKIGISQSVLYYYFENKEQMLREMFDYSRKKLSIKRKKLRLNLPFDQSLLERIIFQLENSCSVVAILKYFLEHKSVFNKNDFGYIPKTAYLHIKEILEIGIERKEIKNVSDIDADAKVITHAINGFVLEYYPSNLTKSEARSIAVRIRDFVMRAVL
ncbi:MAG: TetR/AcrR family transcriptional regulator [Patescibacteria group bacterium]|nr:TetR/AcrR family transcriptional regulator [Patescibacteria group bacterium]